MGIQLGAYAPSDVGNHWHTTLAAAHAAEKAGLDSVWLADHFMFPVYEHLDRENPVFDCFVALGGVAATTTRIRIRRVGRGRRVLLWAVWAECCCGLLWAGTGTWFPRPRIPARI